MENDESVFVYKTIKNKKPKKIIKGAGLKEVHKNMQQEFLNHGLGAFDNINKVSAKLDGQDQIPQEVEGDGEGEEEVKEEIEKPKTPEKKYPTIKNKEGNNFLEDPELHEYLQGVKFSNIRKRRLEGKTDEQIQEELDEINDLGLDDEQKILKSILKKTVPTELGEEPSEKNGKRGRTVKASELVQEKRKGQEGSLISSNIAMRSGIEIPETKEAKERKQKEEEKKAKGEHWRELMEAEGDQDESAIDVGGHIEFKEFQKYSREPIVIYKRLSSHMVRWVVSAGKVFDRHGYYFIPIKIIGEALSQRSTVMKSVIYLELMKFPKAAILGKDFETIWPFLLYLLNNWIRHQFSIIGLTNAKELEERIIQRKEKKQKELLEGKTEAE